MNQNLLQRAIDFYCGDCDPYIIDDRLYRDGELIGSFAWEGNTPIFDFVAEEMMQNQNRLKPFLHDLLLLWFAPRTISELSEYLDVIKGKDYLRWLIKRYNRIDTTVRHEYKTGHLLEHSHRVRDYEGLMILNVIKNATSYSWSTNQYELFWEHLTMCAIGEI